MAMKEISDSQKADAQLRIGLCYYEERDYEKRGFFLSKSVIST